MKDLIEWLIYCVIIYYIATNYLGFNIPITDNDFYISCAKEVVGKNIVSPSSAKFINGKVIEKDQYGRIIVTLEFDSQNPFGVMTRSYAAVVLQNCNRSNGKYTWNQMTGVMIEDSPLLDIALQFMKNVNGWNQLLKEACLMKQGIPTVVL